MNKINKKRLQWIKAALFMAVLIDSLGVALIIPLLSPLLLSHNGILPLATQLSTRHLLYGITLGIYSLFMFFGSPLLGSLSDQIGRKKILIVCLSGTFIGYLFSIFAVFEHSILLLIMGRAISGLTAGSMSIAKAGITDISQKENRTTNIGLILLAASLGYVIGPLLAGLLSNPQYLSFLSIKVPLYLAAVLALLNLILLQFSLKEKKHSIKSVKLSICAGFSLIKNGFSKPVLRRLSITFLLMQLGWAFYFQEIGLFMTEKFHITTSQLGLFMTLIGGGFVLSFCYLLKKLTVHFTSRSIVIFTLAVMSLSTLLTISFPFQIVAWILAIPTAAGLGIVFSVLVSLLSECVESSQQGWIMGFTGSISAFSFAITGMLAGFIANLDVIAPLLLSFILLFFACTTIIFGGKKCHL